MTGTSFTLRGPTGELRWGYHQAAILRDWLLELGPAGLTLTAAVVQYDEITAAQAALTFVVERPTHAWIWPIVPDTLQVVNGTLSARLVQTES
jgi:hypothetical protein